MRILTYSKIISLAGLFALLVPGCAVNPVSGKMNFVTTSTSRCRNTSIKSALSWPVRATAAI
jgi:hypothetical protein